MYSCDVAHVRSCDHLIIDHLEFGAAHVASPLTFDLPYQVPVLSFVAATYR